MPTDKSALWAAVISGAFALVGTVVTSVVSWQSNRPAPEPVPPIQVSAAPLVAEVVPARPDYRLNFRAFQALVKSPAAKEPDKAAAIAACQGQNVVWRGVVDGVHAHLAEHTTNEAAATLTLCEDAQLLDQSMFKQPAYCRMAPSEATKLSEIARGSEVVVTGTVEQHSALGTIVTGCRVLEVIRR